MGRFALAVLMMIATPAAAQLAPTSGKYVDADGHAQNVAVVGAPREAFQLVAANTAGAGVSVYGGDYALSQACSGYGALTFQALGPDATTWLTLASYSAADTGSAHGFSLGSFARVRVVVAGTSGCNAVLARIPA